LQAIKGRRPEIDAGQSDASNSRHTGKQTRNNPGTRRWALEDAARCGPALVASCAAFFARLPNPDGQLIVRPGIAHTSTRSKNWALVYHLLDGWFSQTAPAYTG